MTGGNGHSGDGLDHRFAIIPVGFATNRHLAASVRVVIALASLSREPYTGADRTVEASLNELAEITHIDRRHVWRDARKAEVAGLIRIEGPTKTHDGGFDRTLYVLIGGDIATSGDRGVSPHVGDRGCRQQLATGVSPHLGTLLKEEKEVKRGTPSVSDARERATHATRHQPNGVRNGASKGQRISLDWTPCAADAERARQRGLDPDEEAEAFRDHWHAAAGPKALKRDWDAAFRTWCRISAERRARDRGGARLTAVEERSRRTDEALYRAAIARS